MDTPVEMSTTSPSSNSAAHAAATAITAQHASEEEWLLHFLSQNTFEGHFENFDALLPLLPGILDIGTEGPRGIIQLNSLLGDINASALFLACEATFLTFLKNIEYEGDHKKNATS